MMAFGRVNQEYATAEGRLLQQRGDVENRREKLRQETQDRCKMNGGLAPFGPDDWKHLIAFRDGLPPAVAELLRHCQLSLCAGRVRVRRHDFGAVAKLDKRAPWANICIMMMQYLPSLDAA